ncbi:ArsR/SmtB family transcription factor [Halodesulfovibrio aestuarii]|uniref:ArsR/SmtB family transcription factor n=1 Tax=Halodesulfovibrio aestuarii TaxID=126333 RepID=UPI003522F09A
MQKITQTLKALSDQNRIRIIAALMEHNELCACQLTELLGIAGATVSRHLGILHYAELVQFRKEGRWVFYRLGKGIEYSQQLLDWIHEKAITSKELQQDREQLRTILSCDPEEICRKQRNDSCCSN